MNTNFDKLIRDKMDSGEFQYNPENWLLLQEKLRGSQLSNQAKYNSLLLLFPAKKLFAAASVLFLILLSTWYFLKHEKEPASHQVAAVKNTSSIESKSVHQDDEKLPIQQLIPIEPAINQKKNKPEAVSSIPAKHASSKKLNIPELNILTQVPEVNLSKDDSSNPAYAYESQMEKLEEIITPSMEEQHIKENFIFTPYPSSKERSTGSSFGIVGGVGVGEKNSAYSAGISYTSNLSKAFFLDAAVVLSSSNIKDVASLSKSEFSSFANEFSTTSGLVPVKYADAEDITIQKANYLHVAFNPCLGFHVNRIVALKAGFDIQQRISNSNYLSYVETEVGLKPLPLTDFGLTPKLGVRLNSHWNSTLFYRKGINQLISQKDFFERDYIQIQLGYNF